MPRKADISRLRVKSIQEVKVARCRYGILVATSLPEGEKRWIASMVAVNLHSAWERFAETRLISLLNHHPESFLQDNLVKGIQKIPVGLAAVLVRGGHRYFDFRSWSELGGKANKLVGEANNPFRTLPKDIHDAVDVLSVTRNHIVHQSDSSFLAYRKVLKHQYGMDFHPKPGEFLCAIDRRESSFAKGRERLHHFAEAVEQAINLSCSRGWWPGGG